MGDQRDVHRGDGIGEIVIGTVFGAREAGAVDAQTARRGLLGDVVVGRGTGIAAAVVGGECVEAARIGLLELGHGAVHELVVARKVRYPGRAW